MVVPRSRADAGRDRRGARHGPAAGDPLVFMQLMRAVEHCQRLLSRGMSRRLGISGSERMALRMIGRHPGLSSGELARLLHLNASTLTGVLDRLVRRRLLTRHADARDRRRIVLALTLAGKRLDRVRADTIEARFERALAARSTREMASATSVLEALARELAHPHGARR